MAVRDGAFALKKELERNPPVVCVGAYVTRRPTDIFPGYASLKS